MGAKKPVAIRELCLKKKKIKVEIFSPYLSPDGLFRCEFRIEGAPDGLTKIHVAGVDSYQALTLALKAVAGVIEVYNRDYCSSKLQWMGGKNLNFQFSTKKERKKKKIGSGKKNTCELA